MIRRIIAALAALVLAAVGGVLVIAYANAADERALAGQQTTAVLVVTEAVAEGTEASELQSVVESQLVPRTYVVEGAVTELTALEGQVATAAMQPGEQLTKARFADPEEVRAAGDFALPAEAEDLHQITIPLEAPRALGGNIAPGDLVGIFVSLQPEKDPGEDAQEPPSMTHLTLHKVLVTRVQGGHVASPSTEEKDEGQLGGGQSQGGEVVLVTLALPAPDAEKLVFAMEWGQVWLSYEPENADENGTDVVVVTIPDEVRNLWQ